MSKLAYYRYLKSAKWQAKREEAFREFGKRCSVCGKTERLHVHHKTYDRLGRENVDDLVVLCKDCHEKETKRSREEIECSPDEIPWKLENFVMLNSEELKLWNGELLHNECAFLFSIIPYIGYDGKLKHGNGRPINAMALTKITKLEKTTIYRTIRTLVDKAIIHKKKNSKKIEYFMNPWIFRKGDRTSKALRTMFQNYKIRVCDGTPWKEL